MKQSISRTALASHGPFLANGCLDACSAHLHEPSHCSSLKVRNRIPVQVISRPVYKFVLLKVTNKVVQSHGAAVDATFLVAESGQIQRLVQDYIRHCRVHGIDT